MSPELRASSIACAACLINSLGPGTSPCRQLPAQAWPRPARRTASPLQAGKLATASQQQQQQRRRLALSRQQRGPPAPVDTSSAGMVCIRRHLWQQQVMESDRTVSCHSYPARQHVHCNNLLLNMQTSGHERLLQTNSVYEYGYRALRRPPPRRPPKLGWISSGFRSSWPAMARKDYGGYWRDGQHQLEMSRSFSCL